MKLIFPMRMPVTIKLVREQQHGDPAVSLFLNPDPANRLIAVISSLHSLLHSSLVFTGFCQAPAKDSKYLLTPISTTIVQGYGGRRRLCLIRIVQPGSWFLV